MEKEQKMQLARIIVSTAGGAAALLLPGAWLTEAARLIIYILCAVLVGYDVLWDAVKSLFKGHMLDEHFLMTVGCAGAFLLKDYAEAALILILYQTGELFQDSAVDKSRRSIEELMNIRPDFVCVQRNGELVKLVPQEVKNGELIEIRPGDRIPLDGVIESGETAVDTSALTGESLPREYKTGDTVISGCVNLTGSITVRVTGEYSQSTVARILNMVENVSENKAASENFVTHFAKYYTPIVVMLAALICIIPSIITGSFTEWFYRAVTFLVISCPCALVVSVPLAFFSAIGGASKSGILIKGGNYLEALARADTAVFDKTGTLTTGSFRVTKILTDGIDESALLSIAAACEADSTHPIAVSVRAAAKGLGDSITVSEHTAVSGKGICCVIDGSNVYVGNRALMEDAGIPCPDITDDGAAVYIAREKKYLGCIIIEDTLKGTTAAAVKSLRRNGIKKTCMLTGDRKSIAERIGSAAGIDMVYGELLPDEKVMRLEEIINRSNAPVIYVGDGINDAPVLALADVGIAMGTMGSDAAIEAADVVIMNDDLTLISKAVRLARHAIMIAKENIAISLAVKFIWMALSLFGYTTIWQAVFADVGVLIIAVANSMRTLKKQ